MYLDYSKIKSGQMEQPVLRLRTLAGKELGSIPWAHGLSFEINYSELSTVEFDVPKMTDGRLNPVYEKLTGYKVLYTDDLGIYILTRPSIEGDGVSESKHITGYSLEQLFEKKNLFLSEGTYNFWNPVDGADTILGRIIELDSTWSVGYVAPRLIGCYRTFDEYDSDALSFCYGDAMEKYRCAIVFDVYQKTISAYDADESRGKLPIYLSYSNLVESVGAEELTDDVVTKLHVYGADELSIRDVNPLGTDYIVDLSWFLSNGDLDIRVDGSTELLSDRVREWMTEVRGRQQYYTGLVAARASRSAQKLAEEVNLGTLNGELETLTVQQSVIIQAMALETTESGKQSQQEQLDSINAQITAKKQEIADKEAEIAALESEMADYLSDIQAVNKELGLSQYFTQDEQKVLNHYLVEGDMTEETFVATDIGEAASGTVSQISGAVSISGASIIRVDMPNGDMYIISGGAISIPSAGLEADIVQATFETKDGDGTYILSAYFGTTAFGEQEFPSGMLTMSGPYSELTSDISERTEDEVTEWAGTLISFKAGQSSAFFTVNVSEYQKYSVAQELYDFGEECLGEMAWPVYEFSLDSANFLFQKEFEPFKDCLELGKSIRLDMGGGEILEPNIIGVSINFEDQSSFSLTFSNQFQRKNGVDTWKNVISSTASSSRSFDASKYLYNLVANQSSQVSQFMEGQLNAAVNTILGAANQSVRIDGAGIHVGGDSSRQIRIVDSMIAMTDDNWQTSKLALGLFADEETGTHWGINTELIAGKLIIGNNLVLENVNDEGVMQFKVDATGAWLNNATFVLQKDGGGKMMLDPEYGLVAGTSNLFQTNGTTVLPSFIDEDGELILDEHGMPEDANFFLDLRDGSAYFRGNVYAEDGVFNGTVYATDGEFTGTIHATDGEFSGTIKASTLDGTLAGGENGGALKGISLDIGDGNFTVDGSGNVVMAGSINLSNGSITWGSNGPVKYQFSSSINGPWHDTMLSSDKYRRDSLDGGVTWGTPYQFVGEDGRPGSNGSDANVTFTNIRNALHQAEGTYRTFITADSAGAPTIYGARIYGAEIYAGGVNDEGGQIIGLTDTGIDIFNGSGRKVLTIHSDGSGAELLTGFNYLTINAPSIMLPTGSTTYFYGYADFTNAQDVRGLYLRFS